MNTLALLCREIAQSTTISQRKLADRLGVSLGKANQLIKEAVESGYLQNDSHNYTLTKAGWDYLEQFRVDNAIILAAGFGSRFVPFTYETPKGLLKVKGVPMIERQIEQLKEKGIDEIIVVVGYLKEKFDYLVDKYGVKLVFNPEYAEKNNFVSVYYALKYLKRSYILMADNWIEENIFSTYEPDSWFSSLYFEGDTDEWGATTNNSGRITRIDIGGKDTWTIVGPAFFTAEFSKRFAELTREYYTKHGTDDYYWEHILRENLDTLPLYLNKQDSSNMHEFESLEELRNYDESYQNDTDNEIMTEIARTFGVAEEKITGIFPLKAGITNFSFVFYIDGGGYVFRTPGIGTEKLINRQQEKAAYDAISDLEVADEIVRFDAKSGIKISKYYENTHIVDADNIEELKESARLIRKIHESGATIDYSFDIRNMIDYYRSLAEEVDAIRFSDFDEVARKMDELLSLIDRLAVPQVLCHGDFANTNVIIFPDGSGKMIDWEYSGMSDPIMDISMFAIYSIMSREEIERYLGFYVGGTPSRDELRRLYLYVALGGFLWSIWAEYKQAGGQEFGEYPLQMFRYAKDFYNILLNEGYLD